MQNAKWYFHGTFYFMNSPEELRNIPVAEIVQQSSRYLPVLQVSGSPHPLDGMCFENDIDAVRYKAIAHPDVLGKIEIPLELPMHAAFRLENPDSGDRPSEDFRIVLEGREVAPENDEACSVMPYVLFNGIGSLILRVVEDEDTDSFDYDAFWLNVLEPGMSQPFTGVTDAYLQICLRATEKPPVEVIARYVKLKSKAGNALHRIINTPA